MTLPVSFPLSMSQIATEIGLSLPLSLSHGWVIALAGKSSLPVSFSDLLGQTGTATGNATASSGGGGIIAPFSSPWFRGQISQLGATTGGLPGLTVSISFSIAPNWSGNILLKNNTTNGSIVLAKQSSTAWQVNSNPGNIVRAGFTDNFTIQPSS
ncbi:MAG: hypothetical protein ACN6QT_36455 [Burkholderia contaminans]|uniref:Uncharacterized protein n=1 Tax=Burkholderia contaminans TaxID=488447 RepID=A0AAP4QYT6_9BURK|nr:MULTISPECIES: hypothetical protein [Burkholderia]MBD1410526.1 hypothetical protein [Burkholderia contaminans]MBM6427386.1 hypothetical protein [Burkholderia contaminans]MCA7875637.1 hypothetical protein [Burkholderia contaminans]MDN7564337.1 hypothetical protein [Burkholderia contaminans]MDN8024088.1 hypothetical protein [Burkholderia contaminans]